MFKTLDLYAKKFRGMEHVYALEAEMQLSPREKRILSRFLDGFTGRVPICLESSIIIIPADSAVEEDVLQLCKEGIEEYFLDRVGLDFTISIGGIVPELEKLSSEKRTESDEGVIVSNFNNIVYRYKQLGILSPLFYHIVAHGDFFKNRAKRTVGTAQIAMGTSTLLDRAYLKGRFLDEKFEMTKDERKQYMKVVAAHETNHIVGMMDEVENLSHESRGIPEMKNCLGYSRQPEHPILCDGCVEDVVAFWYGVQLRTGRQYIKPQ
jgi:hypothetical protein